VTEVEGKDLGVVAGEQIQKGDFVCEYKYNLSYDRKERVAWEEEYSVGHLVNHSRTSSANLRLDTPLLVNRKWRVGMYAQRDIGMGSSSHVTMGNRPISRTS
jgi:hypothetical protein